MPAHPAVRRIRTKIELAGAQPVVVVEFEVVFPLNSGDRRYDSRNFGDLIRDCTSYLNQQKLHYNRVDFVEVSDA